MNEYEIIDVVEGTYDGRVIQIAQWAIRDSKQLPGARKDVGAAFTLTVERYDEHPELEGERLISDRETSACAAILRRAPAIAPPPRPGTRGARA